MQNFQVCGFDKTIYVNLKSVDFLDVTFELPTGMHKPFLKPNNIIQYVHTSSNHPRHIIENIPKGVEDRISMLSSNEEIFQDAIPPYQEALDRAGHSYTLNYKPPPDPPHPAKEEK